jgi:hypothetical protein
MLYSVIIKVETIYLSETGLRPLKFVIQVRMLSHGSTFDVNDGTAVQHEGLRRSSERTLHGPSTRYFARNHAATHD